MNQILEPAMGLDDLRQINKVIGNIRVTMMMVSFLGTAVIGAILDKTKEFKLITLINTATYLSAYVRVFNKKLSRIRLVRLLTNIS